MTYEVNRYRRSPKGGEDSGASQILSPLEAKFLQREVLGARKRSGIFAEELKSALEAAEKKESAINQLEVSEFASRVQNNQTRIQAQFQFWQAEEANESKSDLASSAKRRNTLPQEALADSLATDPKLVIGEDKLSITVKLKGSPDLPEIKVTLDPQAREIVAQIAASQQVMALLNAQVGMLERSLAGQGLKLKELRLSALPSSSEDSADSSSEDDYEGDSKQGRYKPDYLGNGA